MFKFIFPTILIERWKWNEEFGIWVSSFGHFRNKDKQPLKLLKNSGYLSVKTLQGLKLAHRLVLLTFRPIPNADEMTVDHIDRNRANNMETNLEWVTVADNIQRAAIDKSVSEKAMRTLDVNRKGPWTITCPLLWLERETTYDGPDIWHTKTKFNGTIVFDTKNDVTRFLRTYYRREVTPNYFESQVFHGNKWSSCVFTQKR